MSKIMVALFPLVQRPHDSALEKPQPIKLAPLPRVLMSMTNPDASEARQAFET